MAIGHHHPLHAYQIGARGSSNSSLVHFICVVSRGLLREPLKTFFLRDLERHSSIEQFLLPCVCCSLYCALWWAGGSGGGPAAVVMEFTSKKKALLVLCFMLPCLLLPRASSAAPLSRSLSLRNRHQPTNNPALEVPAQQDQGAVEDGNLGEVAARMDIEVNDYPGSGANNRHEPRSPGRP